jgi:hypothetical protein
VGKLLTYLFFASKLKIKEGTALIKFKEIMQKLGVRRPKKIGRISSELRQILAVYALGVDIANMEGEKRRKDWGLKIKAA